MVCMPYGLIIRIITDRNRHMSKMHNPPHPGETLREDVLPALGLTVTEAAAQLGVTRAALSRARKSFTFKSKVKRAPAMAA